MERWDGLTEIVLLDETVKNITYLMENDVRFYGLTTFDSAIAKLIEIYGDSIGDSERIDTGA